MRKMYLTCCRIVGVDPGADEGTIKSAFRKSAKELHPDVNDSEKAHYYFTLLQNAYQFLIDNPFVENEFELTQNVGKVQRKEKRRTYYQPPNRTTLQETLNKSATARVMYIFFHFFFIFVGMFLLISSLIDLFFHPMPEGSSGFSAYSTIIVGFLFGILFTTIFSVSAISYFRSR